MSLHEGSVNTFYFILGHYVERQTQFGLIKPDLTPRPGFIALAAVGRLLADAKPLGKMKWTNVEGFLFDAAPDGKKSQVLVAWSAKPQTVETPRRLETCDHLGRRLNDEGPLKLWGSPLFAIFAPGSITEDAREEPPAPAPPKQEKPTYAVLQVVMPAE